jgi:hypothetical protein
MPALSDKDTELFSALESGAGKLELGQLIRDGADVNARDKVLVSINVDLLCGEMPNP